MPYKRINIAWLLAATAMAAAGCGPYPEGSVRQAKANAEARQASTPVERYKECLKDLPPDDKSRDHCLKLSIGG